MMDDSCPDGRRKLFVWKSTPFSVESGTVSVLAMFETVLAISLFLYIGFASGYWYHLIVSASLAPLLLLRSELSTNIGIEKFRSLDKEEYSYRNRGGRYLSGVSLALWSLLALFAIRIYATLQSIRIIGVRIVTNIPRNWRRVALCMDFAHHPEAVAGIEVYSATHPSESRLKEITITSLIRRYKTGNEGKPLNIKIFRTMVYSWVFLCLFIPSIILRLSLKTSTIAYLPFIYFSREIGLSQGDAYVRFKRVVEAKAGLIWAIMGVWIVLTIIPIVFATFIATLTHSHELPGYVDHILNYLTPVPTLERWNVVRALCATITIAMFIVSFFCLKKCENMPHGELTSIALWDSVVRMLDIVRSVGIVYLTLCTILILWYLAGHIELDDIWFVVPEIGKSWLPINNDL